MAAAFAGQAVFHAVSAACSHRATFHVLAAIRKRGADKLARMPLGFACYMGMMTGYEENYNRTVRAIMKDAPVVILDRAAANVDPENEAELLARPGIYRNFVTERRRAVSWKL